jgi:hypothetical protein
MAVEPPDYQLNPFKSGHTVAIFAAEEVVMALVAI